MDFHETDSGTVNAFKSNSTFAQDYQIQAEAAQAANIARVNGVNHKADPLDEQRVALAAAPGEVATAVRVAQEEAAKRAASHKQGGRGKKGGKGKQGGKSKGKRKGHGGKLRGF